VTATAMKPISILLRILHERELEGIYGMLLFAYIFYNHGCKCVEFEALTLTDTSTVAVHMFVTDMAHGYST